MKTAYSILLSLAITVLCFAIVIFRLFYPYHRYLAIGLYIVSWLVLMYPVVRDHLKELKKLKKWTFTIIISIVGFGILYSLWILIPLGSFDIARMDTFELARNIEKDSDNAWRTIVSLEMSFDVLQKSGLFNIDIESSDPQKLELLRTHYEKILAHIIILENLADKYKYFYQAGDLRGDAMLASYAPYIAKYKIIKGLSGSTDYVQTILDEENKFGKNTFRKLTRRFSAPETILRINAGRAYLVVAPDGRLKDYSSDAYSDLFGTQSVVLPIESALKVFEAKTMDHWLPIQTDISNLLGDTRLGDRHDNFITEEQLSDIEDLVESGDIMFQRRNWYISNAGMPGFWTHSALYIGNLDDMDTYFAPESQDEFGMSFSDYLQENYPVVYKDKLDSKIKTLEGKSEGVIMLSMEKSATSDYLAFIRPRLSKKDKMHAILAAFSHYQKPYDFDFDFTTDDSLVCSELVFKAYLPTDDKEGIIFDPYLLAGRYMFAPNDMVRDYAGKADFVLFLDGNESTGVAQFQSEEVFKESWKRPRYDFLLN